MSNAKTVGDFLSGYDFPDSAFTEDDLPRLFFHRLEGTQVTFKLETGEREDDAELLGFAGAAMRALAQEHPECHAYTFRLESL